MPLNYGFDSRARNQRILEMTDPCDDWSKIPVKIPVDDKKKPK